MDNKNEEFERDECTLKGGCSISPTLASVHEVILIYIEELAFYLLELDVLGVHNDKIKTDVIDSFSAVIQNTEFNLENLNKIISTLYVELYQAKELYATICQNNNEKPFFLKSPIRITKQMTVTEAIRQGQLFFTKKEKLLEQEQKNNLSVLLIILKSICIYIVELKGLGVGIDEAYKDMLAALSIMNFHTTSEQKIEEIIEKYVQLDYELMQKKFSTRKESYGSFISSEVSISLREGKAILVCGTNLGELEAVLEATKDRGVDIYTHGRMIVAHNLPKFKTYPHLVGHYGKGQEHYLSDFSAFEGSIFLTRLSLHNVEGLYRSRVFTTDVIASKGVVILRDNNFEPLIQSALYSGHITKDEEQKSTVLGIVEEEFVEKINLVADKIERNEIKHVFIVGVPNKTETQREYMQEFLNLIGDDCFAISFTPSTNQKNVLYVNVDYSLPFADITLNIFKSRNVFDRVKFALLYTRCEPHTFPTIFNMKYMGVEDIYFIDCSPSMVNPTLIDAVRSLTGLKRYTNPVNDYREMVGE